MERVVTVGRIMTASTMEPDRMPAPVPALAPKTIRMKEFTTYKPSTP